jgi:O-antigen/teichoic acid export membrane protein
MSLKRLGMVSAAWNGASSVGTVALSLIQIAILARILSPADFGTLALVGLGLELASVFADGGVSNALVQKQNVTQTQTSSLYWFNIGCGVVAFMALVVVAPVLALAFDDERLASLIQLSAVGFLIGPLGQQISVLLIKRMEFRRLTQVDLAGAIVAALVTIGLAVYGAGIYSLALGSLAGTMSRSCVLFALARGEWRITREFSLKQIRPFISFGAFQMGERVVNILGARADTIIIARNLGMTALGPYSLAYSLALMPLQRLNPVLTRVAFPLFARVSDEHERLRNGTVYLVQILSIATAPVLIGICATAHLLAPIVYGDRWTELPALIQVLSIVGLLKAINNPFGSALLAKGRADVGFWWNLIYIALNVATFVVAVRGGTGAVAWAYLAVSALTNLLFWAVVLRPILRLSLVEWFSSWGPALASGAVMGLVIRATDTYTSDFAVPEKMRLACLVVLGIMVYIPLAAITHLPLARALLKAVRQRS